MTNQLIIPFMEDGRKSTMISARLRTPLIDRVDYVTKNTKGAATSRTSAIREALENWLPGEELDIQQRLGTSAPKKLR